MLQHASTDHLLCVCVWGGGIASSLMVSILGYLEVYSAKQFQHHQSQTICGVIKKVLGPICFGEIH